ncbi:putative defense protein 3 isoform X2 [Tubulanus polymorphus]
MAYLIALILAAVFVSHGSCYSSGAPLKVCGSMQPGHGGALRQTSASPYTITVTFQNRTAATTYDKNKLLTVTIFGNGYKGLLLQAREVGTTTPVGRFDATSLPVDTKLITCTSTDDSLTHSNSNSKSNITVRWVASTQTPKKIKFVATVVQLKPTYWMDVSSPELIFTGQAANCKGAGILVLLMSLVQQLLLI